MKNMMIYAAKWNDKDSFKMMPVTPDCPYNEVIFDPEQKVLAVISKEKKDKPMMMPRLNDRGDIIPTKRTNGEQGWQEQRVIIPAYYEYYLEDPNDIVVFVSTFGYNTECKIFVDTIKSAFDIALASSADLKASVSSKKSK